MRTKTTNKSTKSTRGTKPVVKKEVRTTNSDINRRPLSEYALEALMATKEPMHSKALTEKMVAMGWQHTYAKPEHVVYTTLFGLVRRQGDNCLFRFVGKGVFATSAQVEEKGIETAAIKPLEKTHIVNGQRVSLPVYNTPPELRKCGNCVHCEYTGPQEYYRERGLCAVDEQSGRLAAFRRADACAFWKPRPPETPASRERQKALRTAIIMVNLQVARARRVS